MKIVIYIVTVIKQSNHAWAGAHGSGIIPAQRKKPPLG